MFVYQVLLDTSSLNDSDVFILDNGLKVYQFNAKNAHYSERSKAMSFVGENIKEERNGLPEVTILDGDEVFENEEFWELLGGKLDSLPEMDSNDGTDCSGEPDFSASKKLFRLSNESGSLILSLEKESETLSEDDINEDDVWAITCDDRCFIYVGAGSNKDEKFYVSNSCSSILLAANLNANAPTMLFSNESDTSVWKKLFEQAEEAT